MRKNIFKFMVLFLVLSFFAFTFSNVVRAEENNESTTDEEIVDEPTVDEPVIEEIEPEEPVVEENNEEVSVGEMIESFLNEWLIVILATLGGAGGTGIALALAKKLLQKIINKINESTNANKESKESLDKVQKVVTLGLEAITERIEEFEKKYASNFDETAEKIVNCISEIDVLKTDNTKFKELVALLVSSNPQLASNGYATKILELLNEGSEAHE